MIYLSTNSSCLCSISSQITCQFPFKERLVPRNSTDTNCWNSTTRRSNLLLERRCHSNFSKRLPYYFLPSVWNRWTKTIPENYSRMQVKHLIKTDMPNKYSANIRCETHIVVNATRLIYLELKGQWSFGNQSVTLICNGARPLAYPETYRVKLRILSFNVTLEQYPEIKHMNEYTHFNKLCMHSNLTTSLFTFAELARALLASTGCRCCSGVVSMLIIALHV